MLTFNRRYFLQAILLFVIEILIAIYAHDPIIRPYVGDVLVVILLYCMLKAFVKVSLWPAAIGVLLFSYLIEVLQYFQLVHRLGLGHSRLAVVVIGSSFEWIDLIAYTLGVAFVLWVETVKSSKSPAH